MALDDIKNLIDAGKEKGYLTYNEVNNLIPHDVHSPESLDDLLTTIGTHGIDVLEGQPKLPTSFLKNKLENEVEASDEVELDLTLTALEKSTDPVRIYLAARAEGTFTLAYCDPSDSGHRRGFEAWCPLDQGNCRLR